MKAKSISSGVSLIKSAASMNCCCVGVVAVSGRSFFTNSVSPARTKPLNLRCFGVLLIRNDRGLDGKKSSLFTHLLISSFTHLRREPRFEQLDQRFGHVPAFERTLRLDARVQITRDVKVQPLD